MTEPVEAEFKFVERKWRLSGGEAALFCFWVGSYAAAAYEANNRYASILFVIMGALACPLWGFIKGVGKQVSQEEADWMVDKITNRARHPSRRRITHRTGDAI